MSQAKDKPEDDEERRRGKAAEAERDRLRPWLRDAHPDGKVDPVVKGHHSLRDDTRKR